MSLTSPPPGPPTTTTRREFTAALALTALGACVPSGSGTHPAAAAVPASSPAAGAPDPVAEALLAVVIARYGADVVPAAERGQFRDAVARTLELSRRLRQPSVANGVDPFTSLCPTSAETAAPAAPTSPGRAP